MEKVEAHDGPWFGKAKSPVLGENPGFAADVPPLFNAWQISLPRCLGRWTHAPCPCRPPAYSDRTP
ncbi:hypothetical protein CCMA1212_000786 [Trichoderma ghanense]|uniref:Uncharacterized protein n=1 Tax=Trichoderma ghanense TaxID=65468 RepID=A0ABY2HER5_9HYPO